MRHKNYFNIKIILYSYTIPSVYHLLHEPNEKAEGAELISRAPMFEGLSNIWRPVILNLRNIPMNLSVHNYAANTILIFST